MESTGLLRATAVVKGMASWTQQGSAFLVQISALIFYRYEVVITTDETT